MSDTKELEKAKALIYSVDLNIVVGRLVNIEGWDESDAVKAVSQYRNYLFLRRKFPEQDLPPSEDIDEAWHAHVLFTEEYRKFCKSAFSNTEDGYLDHEPHLMQAGSVGVLERAFETTQERYFNEFGHYIYQVRPRNPLVRFLRKGLKSLLPRAKSYNALGA